MNEIDNSTRIAATDKDFGPQTGLKKRKLIGVIMVVSILGFLSFIISTNWSPGGVSNSYFGNGSENDDVPIWLFLIFAAVLCTVMFTIHRLVERKAPEGD
ncbi:MAG: hypothetical protein HON65_04330 [Rhodospirillales bacterium]|jgi:hypothetical protein|nr:hypothetical protein [Rhodospirillales bacterium]